MKKSVAKLHKNKMPNMTEVRKIASVIKKENTSALVMFEGKFKFWSGDIIENDIVLFNNLRANVNKVEIVEIVLRSTGGRKCFIVKAEHMSIEEIRLDKLYTAFYDSQDSYTTTIKLFDFESKKLTSENIYQLPSARYSTQSCNLFDFIEKINHYVDDMQLQLEPDFQRGHVWTEEQQVAFIEHYLIGGTIPKIIINHPNWMGSFKGEMTLIDGLQRITAIRKFINDELEVFKGFKCSDIDIASFRSVKDITTEITNLETRKDVLSYYIKLNSGGTVHTAEEISRIHELLSNE